MEQVLYIHEQWSTDKSCLLGCFYCDNIKGTNKYSFEFDKDWLNNHNPIKFDSDLEFWQGRQYLNSDKSIFGFLSDLIPDRWGRYLIEQKEAETAIRHNRVPKKLSEVDYLIRSNDKARMGAIRIARQPYGRYLSDDKIANIKSIRDLEEASRNIDDDTKKIDAKSLNMIFSPGSSLGGARPKVSVFDNDGSLWMAKFPSKYDSTNREAWEMVCYELMILCDIDVPEAKVQKYSKYGSTFLVKRFDRIKDKRIHFSSAMNLLGKNDGDDDSGYLDLVSFIKSSGSQPNDDLLELYKRMAFNMLVRNIDDHLRNHGFLLSDKGWRLSPVFDVNPSSYGDSLSLYISKNSKIINFESALTICNYFNISKEQASQIFKSQARVIKSNWESLAKKYSLTSRQIIEMKPAFNLAYELP